MTYYYPNLSMSKRGSQHNGAASCRKEKEEIEEDRVGLLSRNPKQLESGRGGFGSTGKKRSKNARGKVPKKTNGKPLRSSRETGLPT